MGSESRLNPGAVDYVGPQTTKDARGRDLQEGDEIILSLPGPVYFRVAQITPNLDPRAPAGTLFVHVGAMLTFAAKRGAINAQFIRVRTVEEAGPLAFKLLDAEPQEREPERES